MQLFALDSAGQTVHVDQASRHHRYTCPSCQGPVRLRGGPVRARHFYHTSQAHCAGKSLVHSQVQAYLLQHLPGATIEHRFPQVDRIADVHYDNFVFEVQCSPITANEVASRNRDYARLGLKVIWILHDHRFNRRRLTAAERHLFDKPHLFTNIDARGGGWIYSQERTTSNGIVVYRGSPTRADLLNPTSTLSEAPTERRARPILGLWWFLLEQLIDDTKSR